MADLYIIKKMGDLISAFIVIYIFNKVFPPKITKYIKIYSTVFIIIFYTLISSIAINESIINTQEKQVFVFILLYFTLLLIYLALFRRGRISEKFFLSSFYIIIYLISSIAVFIISSALLNIKFAEMYLYTNYKGYIAILFNRFVQNVLSFIFLNNMSFIKYVKDKVLYAGALSFILNSILIMIVEINIIKNSNKINTMIITIMASFSMIQILSIYMLNIFAKEMEEKFILKMDLNRKMHDKEIMDMYTEMIGWKHDFKNHMSMISGLLQLGNKEDVISYIDEIDDSISKFDKNMYTDNIAINSILKSKIKVIEEKRIIISLDLKIDSEIKVSNVDICIILGNLLDNSIEASSITKGYKFIDLRIISDNSRLVIKISNSTNGHVNEVNGQFFTTKNNTINGMGLIQIDNIVKKYNGYINRKHESNMFTTYIMIQNKL